MEMRRERRKKYNRSKICHLGTYLYTGNINILTCSQVCLNFDPVNTAQNIIVRAVQLWSKLKENRGPPSPALFTLPLSRFKGRFRSVMNPQHKAVITLTSCKEKTEVSFF